MKKKFAGLLVMLLGLTAENTFAEGSNCKPVSLRVHGLYTARIDYEGCNGHVSQEVMAGGTHEGLATSDKDVRVEVNLTALVPPSTANEAYVKVGEGMTIDCGGTTIAGRKCDCNGVKCPTT